MSLCELKCSKFWLFFFSSRRRHTRSDRDWSSDVCSSDLLQAAETFVDPSAAAALAIDLGDLRSAVLIRAVNTRSTMVGVIMIIMDTRIVAQGAIKLLTPKMQRALTQFAAMRPDRGPAPSPEPEPVAPARTPAASGRPTSSSSSPGATRPAAA